MLRLPALAGALALACTLPVTVAQAKQGTYQHIGSTKSMTLDQVIRAQRSLIAFDHRVIRGWQESRWVKVTAHVSYATPAALAKPAPPAVRYARAQLRWVKRELRENMRALTRVPGLAAGSVQDVICRVFGSACSEALSVARCESGYRMNAVNGQYLGIFQMGSSERARYATLGYSTVYAQVVAAHNYYLVAGWGPWSCA